ncbi:williams-Beuren syndrome critical region protein 22 [Kickxella alabastrina]|uniref:williams-Beuren syndrome critical region protein 22 n=1 Tax=Kickxella alabastrina TaxID=61397 RepID=UPI00221EF7BC|nr:williams-Beuren syndrome critical region protein 22 [Kickxella alabastrina]KAI7834650.1 williams-Beuren syndrome critical region protein 22 [Kickxella alabastrina]
MSRPEHIAPPELFYGDIEAKKYTSNSRIASIQAEMTLRAVELLNLEDEGPYYLLDIGCGSGLSGEILDEDGHLWVGMDIAPSMLEIAVDKDVEGDLFLQDIGQGMGFRPVFQFYPENDTQVEMIMSTAMKCGFTGGLVVDYPNSKKARKLYLCLFAGQAAPGDKQILPKGLEGDEKPTGVEYTDTRIQNQARGRKSRKPVKDTNWILKKKELARKRGREGVPSDSRYTGRKRKPKF